MVEVFLAAIAGFSPFKPTHRRFKSFPAVPQLRTWAGLDFWRAADVRAVLQPGISGITPPIPRLTLLATTAIFKSSVNLECADDAEASDEAKKLLDGHDVKLWQRDRMVAKFEHSGRRAIADTPLSEVEEAAMEQSDRSDWRNYNGVWISIQSPP